ncbi:MAG: hypothetical protein HN509_05750 [Halobacteriovoraceae bacterium]|nr:hypothetical protein [Halobacteriovoraceae bacterium]
MKEVRELLNSLNEYLKGHQLDGEILYTYEESNLVRCGRNQISLNNQQVRNNFEISIKKGKREIQGSLADANHSLDKLKEFIDEMIQKIDYLPETPFLKDYTPLPKSFKSLDQIDLSKRHIKSEEVVQVLKIIGTFFEGKEVEQSGAISFGKSGYAIINTESENAFSWQGEDYNLEIVLQLLNDNNKEIRVADAGTHFKDVKIKELVSSLNRDYLIKTSSSRKDLVPKKYDVVFGADAIAEMIAYMAWVGLKGESYLFESGMFKKSNVSLGDKVFSPLLSISDAPQLFKREIGPNGIQRKAMDFIKNGSLENFAYSNKATCDRFDVKQNTHFGTSELTMESGVGPNSFGKVVDESIEETVYISYLHYMNFTNKNLGEFTGTSRFGTYLLEKGELQGHLHNIRINDSFLRLFNNIQWISSSTKAVNLSNSYGMRSPYIIHCPEYIRILDVPITGSSAQA